MENGTQRREGAKADESRRFLRLTQWVRRLRPNLPIDSFFFAPLRLCAFAPLREKTSLMNSGIPK
jgi:hypothetical protein